MATAKDVKELLELNHWPDLIEGPNGYAAKRRADIAPFAYELKVNKPLGEKTIQKIVAYAGEENASFAKELFNLCNGVRVGATKFGIYGVLGEIDRASEDAAFHPPLDINVPNIYGRSDSWPESYLIVGFGYESCEEQENQKMYHAIVPHGRLIVAMVSDHANVCREYLSIESWLSSEVQRALDNAERW